MTAGRAVLRVWDQVLFEDGCWSVAGLGGVRVRLVEGAGHAQIVLAAHLLANSGFTLFNADPVPQHMDPDRLAGFPARGPGSARVRLAAARRGARDGLPPQAPPTARPREPYDPARHPSTGETAAKAAELSAAGQQVSAATVKLMWLRYRAAGVWGLIDCRSTRETGRYGGADPRLVTALAAAMYAERSSRPAPRYDCGAASSSTSPPSTATARCRSAPGRRSGHGLDPVPLLSVVSALTVCVRAGVAVVVPDRAHAPN